MIVPSEKPSDESKKLALPFDSHRLIVKSGYEFIEDIIWVKPEGLGGKRPGPPLCNQSKRPGLEARPGYKYVLVYRKQSDR